MQFARPALVVGMMVLTACSSGSVEVAQQATTSLTTALANSKIAAAVKGTWTCDDLGDMNGSPKGNGFGMKYIATVGDGTYEATAVGTDGKQDKASGKWNVKDRQIEIVGGMPALASSIGANSVDAQYTLKLDDADTQDVTVNRLVYNSDGRTYGEDDGESVLRVVKENDSTYTFAGVDPRIPGARLRCAHA